MNRARHRVSRRQVLKGALGTTLGVALGANAGEVARAKRPNIIMIILDALRATSLPMYGCPRNTAPFLQRLSKRSTLYKRCYSSATWTRPAVTGLLTGLHPLEHGNWKLDKPMPADLPTFPQVLGENGYRTGFFTAVSTIGMGYGMENHFEYVSLKSVEGAGRPTDVIRPSNGYRMILEFEQWLRQLAGDPVCAYVHFFPPHGPYNPPPYYIDQSLAQVRKQPLSADYLLPYHRDVDYAAGSHNILGRIPFYQAQVCFSTDPLRYVMLYEANILFADSHLAEFISQWHRVRGGERTVFIITSDHGECMGEHGHFFCHGKMLTDPLLHVPLLIHDTADPAGREISSPVSHLDLADTILKLAGCAERIGHDGDSLLALEGNKSRKERVIVSQQVPFGWGVSERPEIGCAITIGPWRMIYNDSPFLGNHCVLDVLSGGEPSVHTARGPQPFPLTALRKPKMLAEGVTLESLGIHAAYVEAGKTYEFSGCVRVSAGVAGTLWLRVSVPGQDPVLLGEFFCKMGCAKLSGILPSLEYDPDIQIIPAAICEANWRPKETAWGENAAKQADLTWRRLFMFPILFPQFASEDIQFIGMILDPPVVFPGDSVQVTLLWRFLDTLDESPVLWWRLLDDGGEVALEGRSSLDPFHVGSRLSQSAWLAIPPDLRPGNYRFEFRIGDEGNPFTAGILKVVGSQQEAFIELLSRDARLSGFHMLHSDSLLAGSQNRELFAGLNLLAERYPQEGHVQFLLSKLAENPELREIYLRECLAKTSLHRAALTQAAREPWGKTHAATLQQLNPRNECNFDFQNGIRLFGFDLMRSPDEDENFTNLYLKLYWEALQTHSEPYGVTLWAQTGTQKEMLFWFLGTGRHPTYAWKIGEAVVETINVPLPGDRKDVSLSLWIFRYWDFAYAGMKQSIEYFQIPAYARDGLVNEGAKLGAFICDDLPVCEEDLLEKKRQDKSNYQLYDLSLDPLEEHNLADEFPEISDRMRAVLVPILETKQRMAAAKVQGVELSEETIKTLRALGYIR